MKKKLNPEFIDDTERIEEEEDADRSKMLYKGNNKTYDFRKFKTVSVFGNEIRNNINNIRMANDEQNCLAKYIKEYKAKKKATQKILIERK